MSSEKEDDQKLRKAEELIRFCVNEANKARDYLASAEKVLRRAREEYHELWLECEKRACQRIKKAGNTRDE